MIGVCTRCGKNFETTEEDANTPGTVCSSCYKIRETWSPGMRVRVQLVERAELPDALGEIVNVAANRVEIKLDILPEFGAVVYTRDETGQWWSPDKAQVRISRHPDPAITTSRVPSDQPNQAASPAPTKRKRRAPVFRCTCGERFTSNAARETHFHSERSTKEPGKHKKYVELGRRQRWDAAKGKLSDAASSLQGMIDDVNSYDEDRWNEAISSAEDALIDLRELQSEYQGWMDSMPESLQSSPTYELLSEIAQLDLDPDMPGTSEAPSAVDKEDRADPDVEEMGWEDTSIVDSLNECAEAVDGIALPAGFGRD